MDYKWKDGSRRKVAPDVAGKIFEVIRNKNDGVLLPLAIIDEARSKKSPLHVEFTWDDGKAADNYRRVEAGRLIRCLEVVRIENVDCPDRTRAYASVISRQDETRSYISMQDAMEDEDYRSQLLDRAKRDMVAFKIRYQNLTELAGIFAAMDEVVAK